MYDREKPVFNNDDIGFISQGPTQRLYVSLVTYMQKNHLRWYCDVRTRMLSDTVGADKMERWCHTKKGVTMNNEITLGMYNKIVALPKDPPELKDDEKLRMHSIKKFDSKEICLSSVMAEDGVKLDLREFICASERGNDNYIGPTAKGIRINYHMKDDLAKLLLLCYNKMIDIKAEDDLKWSKKKRGAVQEPVEDVAF